MFLPLKRRGAGSRGCWCTRFPTACRAPRSGTHPFMNAHVCLQPTCMQRETLAQWAPRASTRANHARRPTRPPGRQTCAPHTATSPSWHAPKPPRARGAAISCRRCRYVIGRRSRAALFSTVSGRGVNCFGARGANGVTPAGPKRRGWCCDECGEHASPVGPVVAPP